MRIAVCVVVATCCSLAASPIQAQTFTPGVKVGIDFSSLPNAGNVLDTVVGQPSTETSSKVGALVGGFVAIPIMDRLSFEPELDYVMKGVKLNEGPNGGTMTASLRYLEFPLLLKYAVPINSYKTYLLVGPSFGVKASTSGKIDGPNRSGDIDIDRAIRTFDGGLTFAAGVDYEQYLFEFRYTQGLTDVGSDAIVHSESVKNRVFAIVAGIRLR